MSNIQWTVRYRKDDWVTEYLIDEARVDIQITTNFGLIPISGEHWHPTIAQSAPIRLSGTVTQMTITSPKTKWQALWFALKGLWR